MNSKKIILFIIFILGLIIVFSFLGESNKNIEPLTGSSENENEKKTSNSNNKKPDNKKTDNKKLDNKKPANKKTDNKKPDNKKTDNKKMDHKHNYDNYNHYSGLTSSLTTGSTFYGPNGGSVKVHTQSDGKQILEVKFAPNSSNIIFKSNQFTNNFVGPNDELAFVIDHNHQNAIKIVSSKGTTIFITSEAQSTSKNSTNTNYNYSNNKHHSNYKKYNNTPNTYYGSTGDIYSASSFANKAYSAPNKSTNNKSTNNKSTNNNSNVPNNTFSILFGSSLDNSPNSRGIYNSSMPPGIPRSQIPPGQEDLYILKSEIVPPVCPACPAYPVNNSPNKQQKCPPCPACARCPEPSFECKKVPNYSSINNNYLPVPILNDFSTFGM